MGRYCQDLFEGLQDTVGVSKRSRRPERFEGPRKVYGERVFRKYAIVRFSASSSDTWGSHFSNARAWLMSGLRTFGSSVGSGWNRISLEEPVSFNTNLAISMTVSSRGLPILTGS